MKRVRLDPEARDEILQAARWYDERRAGLGHDFLAAVDEAVARLKKGARGGRPPPGVPPDLGVLRLRVRRFPYALVFTELPAAFRVLAITHDRRRPGYWRKRL